MPKQIEEPCPDCELVDCDNFLHAKLCNSCGCNTVKQDHYCDEQCDKEITGFLNSLKEKNERRK